MEGVEFESGTFREACLVTAFYKRQQIDYLRTAAIVLSSNAHNKAVDFLEKYHDEMFPSAKDERKRRERQKMIMMEMEQDKMYEVRPVFTKRQIRKDAESVDLKKSGFK